MADMRILLQLCISGKPALVSMHSVTRGEAAGYAATRWLPGGYRVFVSRVRGDT